MVPLHLQELVQPFVPTRTLRSSSKLLVKYTSSTITYGHRTFEISSPAVWNNLPYHVKTAKTLVQFKSSLKTRLFNI